VTTFNPKPAKYIAGELLANDSTNDSLSEAVLTAPSAGCVSVLKMIANHLLRNGGVDQ
jgi:hypothetical protein